MSLNVYLVHGEDEVRVRRQVNEIVNRNLPVEFQAENLSEIEPPANRPLELASCGGELIAELGQLSMFEDAKRVVVVYNLYELYAAGRDGKKNKDELTAEQRLIRYLDRDLAETPNVVIFVLFEEYGKRQIRTAGALYKFIKQKGHVITFKAEKNLSFVLSDAIMARNVDGALNCFREMVGSQQDIFRIFPHLIKHVRFLIQARLLQSNPEAAEHLPDVKGVGVLREHPFVREKYAQGARRYTMQELNRALQQLLEINKTLYPIGSDVYVPDIKLQIEMFLIELCGRK
ncbi:hypothetical protein JXA32_07305 [Candidatus Sumerlaeota bacterium]|nr:hypothetical protein [Candidatus Sumerlaeota bacterium]